MPLSAAMGIAATGVLREVAPTHMDNTKSSMISSNIVHDSHDSHRFRCECDASVFATAYMRVQLCSTSVRAAIGITANGVLGPCGVQIEQCDVGWHQSMALRRAMGFATTCTLGALCPLVCEPGRV